MKSVIKNIFKKAVVLLLRLFSSTPVTLRVLNYVYEYLPNRALRKIEPLLPVPRFDFRWIIKLPGKKVFFTIRKGEDRIIYHFPLSYKKNDIGIRELEMLLHTFYPTDRVYLDIGANFGLRSIYFSAMGRSCYLFEPNKKCNDITRRFVDENSISNIHIIQKLVGNTKGVREFHLSKNTYMSSVFKGHPDFYNDYLETVEEEEIRIDDFILANELTDKVSIVKIDVEGYEYDVLQGARNLLKDADITLIIEVLEDSVDSQKIYDLLAEEGYRIYSILQNSSGIHLRQTFGKFDNVTIDFICTKNEKLIDILNGYCTSS